MELPPHRPPSATQTPPKPVGQTAPTTNPPTLTPPATSLNTRSSEQFLKNNIAQQFSANVIQSQMLQAATDSKQLSYQVTLSISTPTGNQQLETITQIPLAEGQQLKVEIVSSDRIRITQLDKAALSQLLNQHLIGAITQQEPLSHSLKALQLLQAQLEAQQPTSDNPLKNSKEHLQALQHALQKLLAQTPIKDLSVEGKIKQLIQNSGVMLEAKIKSEIHALAVTQANKNGRPTTLKSALSQLKDTLQQHTNAAPTEHSTKTAQGDSNRLNADLKAQLQRLQQTLQALQRESTTSPPNTAKQTPNTPLGATSTPPLKAAPNRPHPRNNSNAAISQTQLNTRPQENHSAKDPSAIQLEAKPSPQNREPNITRAPADVNLPGVKRFFDTGAAPARPGSSPLQAPTPPLLSTQAESTQEASIKKRNELFGTTTNQISRPTHPPTDHGHFFLNNTSSSRNANTASQIAPSSLEEAVETLLKQSKTGLARIQLNQLQSLLNLTQATVNDPATTQTLQTELPLIGKDNHIEIIQLTIEDKAAQDNDENEQQRQWQINLRFDFEELGLVHIQLNLAQTDASTTLWVEQTQSVDYFKNHLDQLRQSLQKIGLSVNEIQCLHGMPVLNQTRLETHLVDINT